MDDLSEVMTAIEQKGFYEIDDTNRFLKLNFVDQRDRSAAFKEWLDKNDLRCTTDHIRVPGQKELLQRGRITRKPVPRGAMK